MVYEIKNSRKNHPFEQLDFKNFKEISDFQNKLSESIDEAFKLNSNIANFWYKSNNYIINVDSWDFALGFVYGLKTFSNDLKKDIGTKKEKK